jgi:hypothetical protein
MAQEIVSPTNGLFVMSIVSVAAFFDSGSEGVPTIPWVRVVGVTTLTGENGTEFGLIAFT